MKSFIICAPVNVDDLLGGFMPPFPFTDCDKIDCEHCKKKVFIRPDQKQLYDKNKHTIICFLCSMDEGIEPNDIKHLF